MSLPVEAYPVRAGVRVYRLPLEVFPDLVGYAILVLDDGFAALIDCGSGFGDSNAMLDEGMRQVRRRHGEHLGWEDLTHILISHGHIDHFGGLAHVRQRTRARLGIHELDLRVLTHYEQRLRTVDGRLAEFLAESGLDPDRQKSLRDLHMLHKHLFASMEVDFTFQAEGMQVGPLEVVHVPGHCPGHVVFRHGEILFVGDHVLMDVSPHLAPERLSMNTGLGHYLDSLGVVSRIAPEIRLALGGHGPPMVDLAGRISQIEAFHVERLRGVLQICSAPKSLAEISHALFPYASGYHGLLAIEEAGAHVEFLVQRGYLGPDAEADDGRGIARFARLDRSRPNLPDPSDWTTASRQAARMPPG